MNRQCGACARRETTTKKKTRGFSKFSSPLWLPNAPQHAGGLGMDQPGAGCWPGGPCMQGECFAAVRRVREINRGATAEGCPNITDAATRPTQRVQRTNTLTQKHKAAQTKCRPAATRTGAQRRRRATPSRRRLHVTGRASSRGLHKRRAHQARRRSLRSRQQAR